MYDKDHNKRCTNASNTSVTVSYAVFETRGWFCRGYIGKLAHFDWACVWTAVCMPDGSCCSHVSRVMSYQWDTAELSSNVHKQSSTLYMKNIFPNIFDLWNALLMLYYLWNALFDACEIWIETLQWKIVYLWLMINWNYRSQSIKLISIKLIPCFLKTISMTAMNLDLNWLIAHLE